MNGNNFYNKNLKNYARELRSERATKAERYLWKALLSKNQTGCRFLRQRPIDCFIVDFFAPQLGLIIEIDGSSHFNKGEYDAYRQNKLKELGFVVLRFSEGEVIHCLNEVSHQIIHAISCCNEKER